MTRPVLISLLAALPCALATAAHAQPAAAQAEVLFRDGRALLEAGRTAEACEAFAESQRLDPRVTTLLNLAGCREKNGQLATAWGLFLEAESQTRSATDAAGQQLHAVAEKRATALEGRVSRLTIAVPPESRVAGLAITRDGAPVASAAWDRALPTDGGTYTVEAAAPGRTPWRGEVVVAVENDRASLAVPALELAASTDYGAAGRDGGALAGAASGPGAQSGADGEASAGAAGGESASAASAIDTVGPVVPRRNQGSSGAARVVVTGGAVVALGAAVGLELLARATYADAKAEMEDQSRRDELYAAANTRRYAGVAVGVVGVGLAATATWLWLRRGESNRPGGGSALRVLPVAGAARAGGGGGGGV
jgi:hypothetical protein